MPLYKISGTNSGITITGHTVGEKIEHAAAAITQWTPRWAFLYLMRINLHGMATKIKKAIDTGNPYIESVWYKFGGDYNDLKKIVNDGAKEKRIFGVNDIVQVPRVGEAWTAATIAGIIIAATPLIIAIVNALKKGGTNTNDIPNPGGQWPPTGYDANGALLPGWTVNSNGVPVPPTGYNGPKPGYDTNGKLLPGWTTDEYGNVKPPASYTSPSSGSNKILGMSPLTLGIGAFLVYKILQ